MRCPAVFAHFRDGLDRGGSGADDQHVLARPVDAVLGPSAGLHPLALERVQPFELRVLGHGQAADVGDEVMARNRIALGGSHRPQVLRLVITGGNHFRLELDVATQIEAVGHIARIVEDFGLGGKALAPFPLIQQVARERVAIVDAFDIAARAGIAVPVPGAANVRALFEAEHAHAQLTEAIVRIQPAEARADDDDVGMRGNLRRAFRRFCVR